MFISFLTQNAFAEHVVTPSNNYWNNFQQASQTICLEIQHSKINPRNKLITDGSNEKYLTPTCSATSLLLLTLETTYSISGNLWLWSICCIPPKSNWGRTWSRLHHQLHITSNTNNQRYATLTYCEEIIFLPLLQNDMVTSIPILIFIKCFSITPRICRTTQDLVPVSNIILSKPDLEKSWTFNLSKK